MKRRETGTRNLIALRRSYGSTDEQIAEILVQERVCEDFEVARYYVATTDDKGNRRSLLADRDQAGAALMEEACGINDMTKEQLSKILEQHALWLRGDSSGKGADLRNADLSGADLRNADLSGADLRNADLSGADLRNADLRNAVLSGADLRNADLRNAVLSGADLRNADLSGADLSELEKAKLSIVPESGAFEGWKKCWNNVIVRVLIPATAKRSSATGRKCRAEFVIVMEVVGVTSGVSKYDQMTEYREGKTVKCDEWCEDRWKECAGGIHFFLTRIEAENY